eukprot:756155-Hanusia_phi.AAC.7
MASDNVTEVMRMFLKHDETGKTNPRRDQLKRSKYVRKLRRLETRGCRGFEASEVNLVYWYVCRRSTSLEVTGIGAILPY